MIGRIFPLLQAAGEAEGGFNIGEMMMHALTDSNVIDLPWGPWHLPQWAPVQLGPLSIDFSLTKHVVFMILAAVLVAIVLVSAARGSARSHREGVHRGPRGVSNVIEAFILFLRDEVAMPNIGAGGERYVPFIVTLFFFILFTNLLGLLPWGSTATGNISVTGALAVLSLIVVELAGFVTLGPKGYAKTIFYAPPGMGPVGKGLMLLIMTPVEILGKLTKPFALAIRLFANMNAGHFVILALVGLIMLATQTISIAAVSLVGPLVMAVAVMVLDLFVAFLQAYIFSMLTSVFIGLIRQAA
jgi:F-type H+-transporting ATPase subunit a